MFEKGFHKPVLVDEVIEFLGFKKFAHSKTKGKFIDATLGLGGYELFLENFKLKILGIDVDEKSISIAKERLKKAGIVKDIVFEKANFRNISEVAKKHGFINSDIILFDLGVSSYQLESPSYGLSFKYPKAALDMRLDRQNNLVCARDILNFFDVGKLRSVFKLTLSDKDAYLLAREIVRERQENKFNTVGDLLKVVARVIRERDKRLNPATKVFLALRMVVNSEIENLKEALPLSFELLKRGGRLGVISFHSGEDRVVKKIFFDLEKEKKGKILIRKPVFPSTNEVLENPRSRSARLRIIEKI